MAQGVYQKRVQGRAARIKERRPLMLPYKYKGWQTGACIEAAVFLAYAVFILYGLIRWALS